jgi:hypothetical protein
MEPLKKIIFTFSAIAIASVAFAQDEKESSETNEKLSKYGYYMMQEDYLIHYQAEGKADTMTADISLRNGKTLSYKGEIFEKNGTRVFLKEGQCVNINGNIDECDKLKQKLEKKAEKSTGRGKREDLSQSKQP